MHRNCSPATNKIMHTSEGQPATGSPHTSFLIKKNSSIANERAVQNVPKPEAIIIGASEKLMIPSMAYLNSFQKLHFVSPATLSTFSYSSHFVLYPIQPNIPLENLLYSHIDTMASFISDFMSLKSLAPSTTSASDIRFISL